MTIRKNVIEAAEVFEKKFPQADGKGTPVVSFTDYSGEEPDSDKGFVRQTRLVSFRGVPNSLAQQTNFNHPNSTTEVTVSLHTHAPFAKHPRRQGQIRLEVYETNAPIFTAIEMNGRGRVLSVLSKNNVPVEFAGNHKFVIGKEIEIEMPRVRELAKRILDNQPAAIVTFRR